MAIGYETAYAEKTSEKMAQVLNVILIDDEKPKRTSSVTGANRQKYNGLSIAKREIGAKKRLSSCVIIEQEVEQ